jgi:hypothetical protein
MSVEEGEGGEDIDGGGCGRRGSDSGQRGTDVDPMVVKAVWRRGAHGGGGHML